MDIVSALNNSQRKVIVRILILFGIELFLVGYTIASAVFVLISDGQLSAGYAVIPSIFVFAVSSVMSLYITKHTHSAKKKAA
jgi:hypothetical protein